VSWQEIKLGEAFSIKHGFAFKGEYFGEEGQHVVLTPGNFHESGGFRARPSKDRFYTVEPPEDFILAPDDLIVAMTEQGEGLLGSSALVPKEGSYLHNQRIGLIENLDETKLDKGFLYRLFNTPHVRGHIRASASGTKVRHTAPKRIYPIRVRIPPVSEQRRISEILSAYDALTETNRRRIALLEGAAGLLYREWFVHFHFPGHEHVPFTDGLPEGWARRAIADLADIYRGKSYTSAELAEDGGQPFINLKCFERGGGFRVSGLKSFKGGHKDQHRAGPGDTVIAVTDMTRDARIVGQAARVPRTVGENAIYSMDLVKAVPKDGVDPHWFYGMLRFSRFSAEVREEATGATVLHLKPKHIEAWSALVPPCVLRELVSEQLSVIFDQVDNLELQNQKLAQVRDLLLPRLMTGEIAV
jgi:type I restriction enzyme S subunit